MSDERMSGLHFYSLGIVTKDKPRNTDFVMVHPIEKLSMETGDLSAVKKDYTTSAPDATGVSRSDNIQGQADFKAQWIPDGDNNRISAPDVVNGETVRILRYADTDIYFWTTLYREPGIRRLETALYAWGNIASGRTAFDKSSSYWYEVSTHDGYMWWKTTNSNGESHEYDIKIDTLASTVNINDNVGNSIVLDSGAGTITHTANTAVNINTPVVNISNDLNVGGNTVMSGNTTTKLSTTIEQGLNVEGESNMTGALSGSSIKTTGDMTTGGNADVKGDFNVDGTATGNFP